MKGNLSSLALLFALLFMFTFAGRAESPPWIEAEQGLQEGATIEEVIETLGEPLGSLGSQDFRIYHFKRGDVVFRNGQLVSHSLVSAEEARERREEAAARREQIRREREERRAAMLEEGKQLRDQYLSDPAFYSLSPRVRLAFWQRFQRQYPDVDVSLYVALAREETRELERQRVAELERERRILEAEARVAEAEARAREAEARALRRERAYRPYHDTVIVVPPRRHRDWDGKKPAPPSGPIQIQPAQPAPPPGSEAYPFPRSPSQPSPYPFPRRDGQSSPYPFQ